MLIDFSIVIPNLVVLVFMIIILVISIRKSNLQNLPTKYFIINIIFGLLFSITVVIYGLNIFSNDIFNFTLKNIYLFFSGLQIISFFIFLNDLACKTRGNWRTFVVVFLFVIQIMGSLFLLLYNDICKENPILYRNFLLLNRAGYNFLGVFIYAGFGIPIYLKMFRFTKEKEPFFLFISLIFMAFGYLLTSIFGIVKIFIELSNFQLFLKGLGDNLPVIGVFLFMIVYLKDINYIYRIPFHHYLLQIFHKKTNLVISQIKFLTSDDKIKIKEKSFSGLMSAINSLYSNTFQSNSSIQHLYSSGVSILIENGNYVTAIFVTEHSSNKLLIGLKKFIKEFENRFGNEIKIEKPIVRNISEGEELFYEIFPFLKEKKEKKEK